jgi:hypothetical protein
MAKYRLKISTVEVGLTEGPDVQRVICDQELELRPEQVTKLVLYANEMTLRGEATRGLGGILTNGKEL